MRYFETDGRRGIEFDGYDGGSLTLIETVGDLPGIWVQCDPGGAELTSDCVCLLASHLDAWVRDGRLPANALEHARGLSRGLCDRDA